MTSSSSSSSALSRLTAFGSNEVNSPNMPRRDPPLPNSSSSSSEVQKFLRFFRQIFSRNFLNRIRGPQPRSFHPDHLTHFNCPHLPVPTSSKFILITSSVYDVIISFSNRSLELESKKTLSVSPPPQTSPNFSLFLFQLELSVPMRDNPTPSPRQRPISNVLDERTTCKFIVFSSIFFLNQIFFSDSNRIKSSDRKVFEKSSQKVRHLPHLHHLHQRNRRRDLNF